MTTTTMLSERWMDERVGGMVLEIPPSFICISWTGILAVVPSYGLHGVDSKTERRDVIPLL